MKTIGKKMMTGTIAAGVLLGGGLIGLSHSQAQAADTNAANTDSGKVSTDSGFKGRGGDHKGFRGNNIGNNIVKETATLLGVDESAIKDELKQGKTLAAIAQEKGLSEADYLQKLTEAETKAIDDAVAAGKLTQTQADKIKTNLSDRLKKAIENTGFGKEGKHEGFGFGGGDLVKETATLLGVDESAIKDELKQGKTLAAIAQEKGLSEADYLQKLTDAETKAIDDAVAAGKLTQTQADKIKTNLSDRLKKAIENTGFGKEGKREGFGFGGGDLVKETATLLGVDESAIKDELKQGKTLAAIAQEKGLSEADYLQKLTEAETKAIDDAVAAGKLTQTQADKIKTNLSDRLKKEIENTFSKGFEGKGHAGAFRDPDAVAQALGISKQELTTALQAGKSVLDLAKEKGISEEQLRSKLKEIKDQNGSVQQDQASAASAAS
ncbi:YckD family protein [Paenibacillus sp. P25]|nr:YckD family protein [Paenibacillus sp. P25]